MNVKVLASLLVIGIVGAMLGAGTFAAFSDSETSSGNVFAAGTLDISLGSASLEAAIANMAPGDSKTVTVIATNDGSLPLTYTASAVLSGDIMLGGANDPTVTIAPATGPLESGGSATLIATITLPLDAGNEYQDLSGNVAITVNAVQ